MARIIATGQTKAFYAEAGLFQTGVLGWLARGATQSVDIFVPARFVMLELFWLNVVLLALATGERLLSRRGLIALVGAATLAPLWDFGFEIRPDNLLLCGVLLMWCVVRVRPKGLQPFFIAGALAVGLQFVAFEAAAFTLPISAAILALPPTGSTCSPMEAGPGLGSRRGRHVCDYPRGLWGGRVVGCVYGGCEKGARGCHRGGSLGTLGSPETARLFKRRCCWRF